MRSVVTTYECDRDGFSVQFENEPLDMHRQMLALDGWAVVTAGHPAIRDGGDGGVVDLAATSHKVTYLFCPDCARRFNDFLTLLSVDVAFDLAQEYREAREANQTVSQSTESKVD